MIAQAALKIATEKGLHHVNHSSVAKRCPIETSANLVRYYFPTQIDLQMSCVALNEGLRESAVELGII